MLIELDKIYAYAVNFSKKDVKYKVYYVFKTVWYPKLKNVSFP